MSKKNSEIQIDFLDHVAIRVKDMEASAQWYQKILGLKKYKLSKWGDFPIFLLAGKAGIALFPANSDDPKLDLGSRNVKIDHFAFNVNQENFKKAIKRYKELNLEFSIQDHHYFDSIYTQDPDGHTVELTSIKVNETDFYK
ncbi:VOC family protein [Maribacter sp. PR1]|uniref:VOC family protein n=1 Tax=Maribacter cobaltidurans TaxID=1178778 RepID=A0ABU7J032_9FLAO|nr:MULTISPECIES: VOC family protein [Maribacter]MDC6390729.1 VOC family protein [Maribacter sp. PR1]MEE1978121.1 VOC family protein [Maribacter cobaltidurans]